MKIFPTQSINKDANDLDSQPSDACSLCRQGKEKKGCLVETIPDDDQANQRLSKIYLLALKRAKAIQDCKTNE